MIRNDKEYRHIKEERLSELEAELKELSSVRRSAGRDEAASAVIDALRMQIEDLELEISEYEESQGGASPFLRRRRLGLPRRVDNQSTHSVRSYAGRAGGAVGYDSAAGGALRAGRVAEDQRVAPGRDRQRFGVRCEHPCQPLSFEHVSANVRLDFRTDELLYDCFEHIFALHLSGR
jgi:hypothetical protein